MVVVSLDRTLLQDAILVVEDEVLIRLDLVLQLRAAGYSVVAAANGDEALTVLQAVDTIALVITDVQMPGKTNGFAVASWLRHNSPHIKVIIVSGYSPSAESAPLVDVVLEKPVNKFALLRDVKRLLADAHRAPNKAAGSPT